MADTGGYLRIILDGTAFLLPGNAAAAVERRENLRIEGDGDRVGAWRVSGRDRWPALLLDRGLKLLRAGSWQQAVFVRSDPQPVGLLAASVEPLTELDVTVERFTSPGAAPTARGPLFSGAWVRGTDIVLQFDPDALAAYLSQLRTNQ